MSSSFDQIADSTWFKTGKLQVQRLASAMSISHVLSLQEICEKYHAHLLSGTLDVYLNYGARDETDVEDGVQFWCVNATFRSVLKQKYCAEIVRTIKCSV